MWCYTPLACSCLHALCRCTSFSFYRPHYWPKQWRRWWVSNMHWNLIALSIMHIYTYTHAYSLTLSTLSCSHHNFGCVCARDHLYPLGWHHWSTLCNVIQKEEERSCIVCCSSMPLSTLYQASFHKPTARPVLTHRLACSLHTPSSKPSVCYII